MTEAIYPLELPVGLDSPRLNEFVPTLRSQGQPIKVRMADDLLPFENCYWNVLRLTEEFGGEIVFGWMIKHWPGLYLCAEHHAVWRWPGGDMLDVTERHPETSEATTFLLDQDQAISIEQPPNVPIQYFPLSTDSRVTELLSLSGQLSATTQQVNHFLASELGLSNQSQVAVAQGTAPAGIEMSALQLQTYQKLVQQSSRFRVAIGSLISSLINHPPNRIARAATLEHLRLAGA